MRRIVLFFVFISCLLPAIGQTTGSRALTLATNDLPGKIISDGDGNLYELLASQNYSAFPINFDFSVVKLDSTGKNTIWTTATIAGSGDEIPATAILDGNGNLYVLGTTTSVDFPVTPGAYNYLCQVDFCTTTFVTKISPTGQIIYNARLQWGNTLAVNAAGEVVVGTPYGVIQKLNSSGSAIAASFDFGDQLTGIGGIAFDLSNNIVAVGTTTSPNFPRKNPLQLGTGVFVTKFDPQFNILFSTTLVGDSANSVAINSDGDIYLAGRTSSPDFPVTQGSPPVCIKYGGPYCSPQAFVLALKSDGSDVIFSTVLGVGTANALTIDSANQVYVAGLLKQDDLTLVDPICLFRINDSSQALNRDAFVAELSKSGTVLFSTYLGSDDEATSVAVDRNGNILTTAYDYSQYSEPLVADFPLLSYSTARGNPLARIDSTTSAPTLSVTPNWDPNAVLFPRRVIVRNTSALPLDNISITGLYGRTFWTDCPSSLPPAGSCFVGSASYSGSYQISSNAINSPVTFRLAPSTGASALLVKPDSLKFPATLVGQMSAPQNISITNVSDAEVDFYNTQAISEYSVTSTCGSKLAAGATCNLQVTFIPAQAGVRDSGIWFGQTQSAINYPFSGSAYADALVPSAPLVDFANQYAFQASLRHLVTLTNIGPSLLPLASVTASGDFSQANDCPPTLASQSKCNVFIRFTPTTNGYRVGELSVVHADASAPTVVKLQGIGQVDSDLSLSTTTVGSRGNHVPLEFSGYLGYVWLTNTSQSTISITGIDSSAEFPVTKNNCHALAPGEECDIWFNFVPTALGDRTVIAKIHHTGHGSPQLLNLQAYGITALVVQQNTCCSFDSDLSPLDFGTASNFSQVFGSWIYVINWAPVDMPLSITTTGDFIYQGSCPPTLTAPLWGGAQPCSFRPVFAPTSAGVKTGSLIIQSPGYPHVLTIPLKGIANEFLVTPTRPARPERPLPTESQSVPTTRSALAPVDNNANETSTTTSVPPRVLTPRSSTTRRSTIEQPHQQLPLITAVPSVSFTAIVLEPQGKTENTKADDHAEDARDMRQLDKKKYRKTRRRSSTNQQN